MNERQRRFVREYVKCLDGAEAVRRAGYQTRWPGYRAQVLLRNTAIRAAVGRGTEARERRILVTADRVIEEYARIAFADIRHYVEWGPDGIRLRRPEEIDEADAAAIAEIATAGRGARGGRIKLHDKKAALAALARHLGLVSPRRAEAADPAAQREEAAKLRQMLMERVAALAAPPDKPANGEDS